MMVKDYIFPIFDNGLIIGQCFLADGYIITAAHVIRDWRTCFANVFGEKIVFSEKEPSYLGGGDIDREENMVDVAIYKFKKISPLHLSVYIPNKGELLDSCCIQEMVDYRNLGPQLVMKKVIALSNGLKGGNYFYCDCSQFGGSSGSPILIGNLVVGVMHGGNDKGLCAFLKAGVVKQLCPTELFSTEAKEDDIANAYIDEFGVKYSRDKRRLLRAPVGLRNYVVKEGTQVICDYAFNEYVKLGEVRPYNCIESITIPDSVVEVGQTPFICCQELRHIYIPLLTKNKFDIIFKGCGIDLVELLDINDLNGWRIIERRPFSPEEISDVEKAEVVDSQFDKSVFFHMNNGGSSFIPLVKYSSLATGENVDLNRARYVTLYKPGDANILRIEAFRITSKV